MQSFNAVCGLFLCFLLCEVCVREALSQRQQHCQNGWNPYVTTNNQLTCTWYSSDKASWIDAMNWCKVLGGQLVELGSHQFNMNVMAGIKLRQTGKYWIGATDMENEMQFKWMTSGVATPMRYFQPGQLKIVRSKNCVATDEKALWSVEDCKAQFFFICQKL